jgi:hypothetical protein
LIWVVGDPSAALHANSFHFERAAAATQQTAIVPIIQMEVDDEKYGFY